jgi:hypothetical protein
VGKKVILIEAGAIIGTRYYIRGGVLWIISPSGFSPELTTRESSEGLL